MSAILLIGFNRPEFTSRQLNKLKSNHVLFDEIYLHIDGAREGSESDRVNQEKIRRIVVGIEDIIPINYRVNDQNLGLTRHIAASISSVLERHSAVIVLEDDVEFEINSLISIGSQLDGVTKANMPNPVIGMSGLSKKSFWAHALRNKWRTSQYFCAWGYGINREFWKMHKDYHSQKRSIPDKGFDINNLVSGSKRKKKIWEERFMRGIYDYEIQETLFANHVKAFAPRFRIVGNLGHGPNSTHTRFPTPRYLQKDLDGGLLYSNLDSDSHHKCLQFILDFMDSRTFGGDSIFSVRGRTFGIRSLFKSISRNRLLL